MPKSTPTTLSISLECKNHLQSEDKYTLGLAMDYLDAVVATAVQAAACQVAQAVTPIVKLKNFSSFVVSANSLRLHYLLFRRITL